MTKDTSPIDSWNFEVLQQLHSAFPKWVILIFFSNLEKMGKTINEKSISHGTNNDSK